MFKSGIQVMSLFDDIARVRLSMISVMICLITSLVGQNGYVGGQLGISPGS